MNLNSYYCTRTENMPWNSRIQTYIASQLISYQKHLSASWPKIQDREPPHPSHERFPALSKVHRWNLSTCKLKPQIWLTWSTNSVSKFIPSALLHLGAFGAPFHQTRTQGAAQLHWHQAPKDVVSSQNWIHISLSKACINQASQHIWKYECMISELLLSSLLLILHWVYHVTKIIVVRASSYAPRIITLAQM